MPRVTSWLVTKAILFDLAYGFPFYFNVQFSIGMYRISGSYPVIRPIFHYPVSGLLLNYPVSGRISYWYPAGYRIIAVLVVTSSSRNTPLIVVVLGEDHDDVTSNYELL